MEEVYNYLATFGICNFTLLASQFSTEHFQSFVHKIIIIKKCFLELIRSILKFLISETNLPVNLVSRLAAFFRISSSCDP